jgi:hypothetical protein
METERDVMKPLVLSLAAAAVLVAGCGHPYIPAAYVHPVKKPDTLIGSANVNSKPLLGVDLYATSNYSAAAVTAYGDTMIPYIKNVLKANAVGIDWGLHAPSRSSDTVKATGATLSPANVAILTKIAKKYGLKVAYRPLIFGPGNGWEGKIYPKSPAKWFNSYYNVLSKYIKDAQRLGVTEFVAETEMHALNKNSGWTTFFKRIAKAYHGIVTYASWDGDYFPPNSHLQKVAALGVDFYEQMPKLPASASQTRVLASWESWFKKMPASVRKRTTLQEIGIEARAGAYADPANLGATGKLDQTVQARWFTAACDVVHKYDMRGVFFWKVDLADNPYSPTSALSVFEGRQGAVAIKNCAKVLG